MPKQVQITPEVRAVLVDCTIEGGAQSPVLKLPDRQLDRPLYEAVNKVLVALGGKWNRGVGGHVFSRPLDGPLADALNSGTAIDHKRTLEQFWTPPDVVRRMCDLAGDIDGLDVLEPSAGNGCILFEIIGRGGVAVAVEIDEAEASQLSSETEGRVPVFAADFMHWSPSPPQTPEAFDLVLMNPPFSRGQDMAHVERALGFVRPGGCLVAIMSPHWRFADDRQSLAFRHERNQSSYLWTPLPDASFATSGTRVSAGILIIHKEPKQ